MRIFGPWTIPWALLATTGLLLSGCTSLVPHRTSATALPGGVTEYRDPSFDNPISPLGWAYIGATTAGGAYQGYRSNLAVRWTGWEQAPKSLPIANAALGALSGLATGLLTTWITGGDAPPVTSDNAADWLYHLDDRMTLVGLDTLHPGIPLTSIRAVPRSMLNR